MDKENDENEVPKNETEYVAMSSEESSEDLSEYTDERLNCLIELEKTRINSLTPLEKWAEQFYPFWIERDWT